MSPMPSPCLKTLTLLAVTYWLTGDMTVGNFIDHIYEKGGEPSIPSKKGQNLSAGVTGGNSKKDTWWKNIF